MLRRAAVKAGQRVRIAGTSRTGTVAGGMVPRFSPEQPVEYPVLMDGEEWALPRRAEALVPVDESAFEAAPS